MGDTSGTGVCFTRDPNNGEDDLFGEFLVNAQGEDVVAGIRTPRPISELETEMPGERKRRGPEGALDFQEFYTGGYANARARLSVLLWNNRCPQRRRRTDARRRCAFSLFDAAN